MAILSIDEIIAANDVKVERVKVPEWGDEAEVCVRGMTGRQLDFETSQDKPNVRARVVAWCLCDEDGKAINPSPEQVAKLGDKSGSAVNRICNVALRLSGIGGGALEDTEKN